MADTAVLERSDVPGPAALPVVDTSIEVGVKVDNVSVIYPNGHVGLSDASFELGGGTICALVGINGSGKSTLFKAYRWPHREPHRSHAYTPGPRRRSR